MPFNLLPGKLFLGFVLLFALALVALRPVCRREHMALLLFAIYAASVHRRFLLFFVLMFTPMLSSLLTRVIPKSISNYASPGKHIVMHAVLMSLLAAGLIYFFPSRQQLQQIVASDYPEQAVAYLRQHPDLGPTLNQYDWGGYLIWSLGPARKVFIDGRADIYERSGILADYLSISNLDSNALPLLRKYGIEACLVGRQSPLATVLASLPGWKREYSDPLSSIFVYQSASLPGTQPETSDNSGASEIR
jgi:hypothetical protein